MLRHWEQNWWGWEVLNNRLNNISVNWMKYCDCSLIISVLLSEMRDNAWGIGFHPQILFSTFDDVWIPTCIWQKMHEALVLTHRSYFRLFGVVPISTYTVTDPTIIFLNASSIFLFWGIPKSDPHRNSTGQISQNNLSFTNPILKTLKLSPRPKDSYDTHGPTWHRSKPSRSRVITFRADEWIYLIPLSKASLSISFISFLVLGL